MAHSRWMLALLVVLVLGAWFGLGRIERSERPAARGREGVESAASLPPGEAAARAGPVPLQSPAAPPVRVALEDPVPAASPPAAVEGAHLTLRVVAWETGAALPDMGVWLRLPRADPPPPGQKSRGRAGERLRTDAHGRAEYDVASGTGYRLDIAGGGEHGAIGHAQDVAAFAPGERRELVVRLVTELDLVWFARVLDGQTGAPIPGARVERLTGSPFAEAREPAATSATDGVVHLLSASSRASFARVEHPGYVRGLARIGPGHERPSAACSVLLFRPATLEVLVRDAHGAPRPGVTARLTSRTEERVQCGGWDGGSGNEPPRKGLTDASGRCLLAGLPARADLTLELLHGFQLLRREDRPLRLDPGEVRRVACTVGIGCTIRGLARMADGRPAANMVVWLAPDDGSGGIEASSARDVVATTHADRLGRFSFEGVAAGAWRIAPAPMTLGSRPTAYVARKLVIAPDQAVAEVTLERELLVDRSTPR